MATKVMSQQDSFLNQARKENIMVTIHLINGFQLKGFVKGFDNFTVVLESMGRQQLIYKHAISTISPGKPFSRKKFLPSLLVTGSSGTSRISKPCSSSMRSAISSKVRVCL